MSSSVVDQPTEIRSDRSASTPIAARTGDGSMASLAARAAGMHGDAGLVEPEQHRLGFDAGDPEAHDVRQPSVAVAVERDAGDLGSAIDELLGEPPGRLFLALETGRQSARGGAPADDRRHVLEAGPARPLLVAAEQQRADAKTAPHEQRADSGRSPHLVRAHGQQIDAEVVELDRHVPGGLRGVDVEEDASFVAGLRDLRHGLHGADLVVAPLHVDERGVGRGSPSRTASTWTRPVASQGTHVISACAAAANRTAECSTSVTTMWWPRSPAPHVAAAMASVAPLVKTTSRLRAPSRPATASRASSTATRAAWPSVWMRAGSDASGEPIHSTMASIASGRVGEVEAWSR